jgi:elongation factor 1 alpha-like protein
VVAVNKLDMVGWSHDRFDEISQQASGFLNTTGFQPKNISFVPISGLNGDNLIAHSTAPEAAWYQGATLLEELEASEPLTRALRKPFRMSISEIFRTQQSQLTIAGRIDAGTVQSGDVLLVQPSGEEAFVKSIEVDSEPADWAVAGQNANLALVGIDPIHVRVGDTLCDRANPVPVGDVFTLKVLAFDHLMPMSVEVIRGRLQAPGQIASMPAVLDKATGAVIKKKPRIVPPASVAHIIVKMKVKVPLEAGQRVVLRSEGQTVAAGMIVTNN